MKLRSFTCFLLIICIFTAVLLSGCNRECQHKWEDYGCGKKPYCPKCKIWGETKEHNFEGTSCFQYGTCTHCETVQDGSGHQWVEATATEPVYCSVCGITITLPEVSDADLSQMPTLSSKMTENLAACSLQHLEYEIDSIMAGILSAYNSYSDHNDMYRLAKTLDMEFSHFDAVFDPLLDAEENNEVHFTGAFGQKILLEAAHMKLHYYDHLTSPAHTYDNSSILEKRLFDFENDIKDTINDFSQYFYGTDLI